MSFIDDITHYVWVYFLKRKNQVFEKCVEWKKLVEKESGETSKILRTENREFTSSEFEAYLKIEGVRRELTIPKTPEQYGTAKHMNRTLVEAAHSMLSVSHLPLKFWAEALSTTVYVRNRSPTKALRPMTPQEAWTGEKPYVDHFRVFGCHLYVHIPKDERKKLDFKSKNVFFWGMDLQAKAIVCMILQRKT